ncbi:MAG: hypothetical protein Q9222_000806 [Ikaeria aurantiellina]
MLAFLWLLCLLRIKYSAFAAANEARTPIAANPDRGIEQERRSNPAATNASPALFQGSQESNVYWPLESPNLLTSPSVALRETNTSVGASLPSCNGKYYGRNLNLDSCLQVLAAMSSYVGTKSFGQRGQGTGYHEAPLPFRYLSHDGRCAVDLNNARGVASDVVAPIDLKNAARAIIQVCVSLPPNEGGLITGLGEGKGLALRVVPYRPTVTCGPDGSGPPW